MRAPWDQRRQGRVDFALGVFVYDRMAPIAAHQLEVHQMVVAEEHLAHRTVEIGSGNACYRNQSPLPIRAPRVVLAVYCCGWRGICGGLLDMGPRVWELALLTILACLGLGVTCALDEEMFAAVFAAEAAIEAVYLTS
jgi:hypothetical protein